MYWESSVQLNCLNPNVACLRHNLQPLLVVYSLSCIPLHDVSYNVDCELFI